MSLISWSFFNLNRSVQTPCRIIINGHTVRWPFRSGDSWAKSFRPHELRGILAVRYGVLGSVGWVALIGSPWRIDFIDQTDYQIIIYSLGILLLKRLSSRVQVGVVVPPSLVHRIEVLVRFAVVQIDCWFVVFRDYPLNIRVFGWLHMGLLVQLTTEIYRI